MGTLYRDNGEYKIATRGSFDSEQAQWATEYLNKNWPKHLLSGINNGLTLIFEIIYPGNRIVVDYGQREDLVLLAVRNRHTGEFAPYFPYVELLAETYGFSTPKVYSFNDITEIIETCGAALLADHEGYVVEFSDGSRWKFKTDRYLELHRLINQVSWKNVLKAYAANTVDEMFSLLPDEFMAQVREWVDEIEIAVIDLKFKMADYIIRLVIDTPHDATRKDFALWIQKHVPKEHQSYVFSALDSKPYLDSFLKTLEKRHLETSKNE
jgi:RNA ligase